ncbi:MAG TPA: thiamine pyrophosphate-dependent enzyme [Fimbriiglobus sp.]|jgi:2-oxoisovalerate dehydrogenase E1 component alpha subunit
MIEPSDDSDEGSFEPPRRGRTASLGAAAVRSGRETLSVELALTLFRQMVRTRALEERAIKMSKSGEAYFWIGGPGEEAFNVCLGLQVHRGAGPAFDYVHLHYRNAGVLLAMGMSMADHFRQLAMTKTDPHSWGRNFVGHYAIPDWNVIPVTSVIEVQFSMAPGTAIVQKRHGGEGITLVAGGDAGAAEGDFDTCLNWSSLPERELPVLMLVTNNHWGISTPEADVHGDKTIAGRAAPYGIRAERVDGNDPIATWHAIDRAMRYCRRERKPFLLEAGVSRLHGHSSSSGAMRNWAEADCISLFEQKLIDAGATDVHQVRALKDEAKHEADEAVVEVMQEPRPTRDDVFTHTYAPSPVDAVYPQDYTGLPKRK